MYGVLRALTPEAEQALGGYGEVTIPHLPFRVGRDSRTGAAEGWPADRDRRLGPLTPNNDLYLADPGRHKFISREHFLIEAGPGGGLVLRDRGSTCGTLVGNRAVGGHGGERRCALDDGNVVVIGSPDSPYAFQFVAWDRAAAGVLEGLTPCPGCDPIPRG